MAKSKTRKGHNKRVAKRKEEVEQQKRRYQKFQTEMLMKLIEQEKQKGAFENTPGISPIDIPTIDVPQGPQI